MLNFISPFPFSSSPIPSPILYPLSLVLLSLSQLSLSLSLSFRYPPFTPHSIPTLFFSPLSLSLLLSPLGADVRIVVQPLSIVCERGSNVTLSCKAEPHEGTHYQWFFKNNQRSANDHL